MVKVSNPWCCHAGIAERIKKTRMHPLKTVNYGRFPRCRSEISLGKMKNRGYLFRAKIRIWIEKLFGALADPLVHLVRNSVETMLCKGTDAREANGKPRVGNVFICGSRNGWSSLLSIENEVPGKDADHLRARCYKGLMDADAAESIIWWRSV